MQPDLYRWRGAAAIAAAFVLCQALAGSNPDHGQAARGHSAAIRAELHPIDPLPSGAGAATSELHPQLVTLAESVVRSLWLRFLPWAGDHDTPSAFPTVGGLWRAPVRQAELGTPLVSDGQFVWGPNAEEFDPSSYLWLRASPLLPYADELSLWSSYSSVNPMVLLTVLEMQHGWVSDLPQQTDPIEVGAVIESTAMALASRFYEHLYLWGARRPAAAAAPGEPAIFLADGSAALLEPSVSSGTYAVLSVLGPSLEASAFEALATPGGGTPSFPAVFGSLFPAVDPLDESNVITPLAAPPVDLFQFPFPLGATWIGSGPHSWNGGSYPPPFSSLDFFTGGSTCSNPANLYTVAAAYGTARRPYDYNCWLELDHGLGWVTSYYHLRNLYSGAPLGRNGKVGTIACEICAGGFATGPHVHFSLKYNGAYTSLEGVKLSGWTVHVGSVAYTSGSYERGGVFLNPYSQLKNDYQVYFRRAYTSLRFFGNRTGDIDRVKVRLNDLSLGPPVNVGNTDFTLEWWLKAAPGENTAGAIDCGVGDSWRLGNILLDRDRGGQDRDYGVSLANGRVAFGVGGSGTGNYTLCGSTDLRDGKWHHIAIQRRLADGWMWIYVDGLLQAQADGPDGDISYPSDATPLEVCGGPCVQDPFLVIGAEKHGADPSLRSFGGWIDELRISRGLRYSASFAPSPLPFTTDPNTVALFGFDDSPGTSAFDTSGYPAGPSNGTLMVGGTPAGPVWSTDIPFPFPTPTPTATLPVTGTPTPSRTPTPSGTPTASPTSSLTASPSPTPTHTMQPSTATASPTLTATPGPTASSTAPAITPVASPTPIAGDLNGDGRVDVLDVQLSVNVFLGVETDELITARADVNRDGIVNVLDIQLVVNRYLGG